MRIGESKRRNDGIMDGMIELDAGRAMTPPIPDDTFGGIMDGMIELIEDDEDDDVVAPGTPTADR